jgi:hypothetical protein
VIFLLLVAGAKRPAKPAANLARHPLGISVRGASGSALHTERPATESTVISPEEPLAARGGSGVQLVDVDEFPSAPDPYLCVLYVLSTGVLWRQGAHSLEI